MRISLIVIHNTSLIAGDIRYIYLLLLYDYTYLLIE